MPLRDLIAAVAELLKALVGLFGDLVLAIGRLFNFWLDLPLVVHGKILGYIAAFMLAIYVLGELSDLVRGLRGGERYQTNDWGFDLGERIRARFK